MPSDTEATTVEVTTTENSQDKDASEKELTKSSEKVVVEEEEEEEEEGEEAEEKEGKKGKKKDDENEAAEEEEEEEEENDEEDEEEDDDDEAEKEDEVDFDELENEEDDNSEAEAFGGSDEDEDLLDPDVTKSKKRSKRGTKESAGSKLKRSRTKKGSSSSSSSSSSSLLDEAEELEREEEGGEEEGDGDVEPSTEEAQPEENENHKSVGSLVDEMRKALRQDLQDLRNKRPALKRLELLPKLKRELIRPVLFEEIFTSEVYTLLARWLMRLPNGSWPHVSIRTAIIQILLTHKNRFFDGHDYKEIRDLLRGSQLASAIKYLSESEEEPHDLRQKASQLVVFWARMCRAGRREYDDDDDDDESGRRRETSPSASRPQMSNSARRREKERQAREKEWIRSQKIPTTLFVKPSYDERLKPAESTVDIQQFTGSDQTKRGTSTTIVSRMKKFRGR